MSDMLQLVVDFRDKTSLFLHDLQFDHDKLKHIGHQAKASRTCVVLCFRGETP